MLFDTWGAILQPDDYRRFSLAAMKRIVEGLQREKEGRTIPVILFTKGAGQLLGDMVDTGCDALGVDWTTSMADARKYTSDKVSLQGNLNPAILRETPAVIRQGVATVLESYGAGPGHIFNLGHGVIPDTDPAILAHVVEMVHSHELQERTNE